MDLDKLILRLFTVVAKKLKHKHYTHTVNKQKEYLSLFAGVGLDEKLKQYVRRESKELFEQRVALTNHIVTSVTKNLMDPFYKIPRSNSGRRVLSYTGDDGGKKVKEVESILDKFWGNESWDDYMATRFVELNSIDPNSFVVFEFKEFDAQTELIQPYPYEVSSAMAIDYAKVNKVLDYLIVQDAHNYKNPEDLAKQGTDFSILPDPKKEFSKGKKYTLYTKNETIRLLQVGENELMGLTSLKEGVPTAMGTEGKSYVMLDKKFYEYQTFKPHDCKQVPAVQVGYYRDFVTGGDTFVSPIHPAIPYLNKSITVNSHLDLVATLLAFPQQVMYAEKCDAQDCYEGTNSVAEQPCSTCNGTGKKITAPSIQDAIILELPDSKEQMLPLDQLVKHIAPPTDTIKWQEDYIDKLTFNAKRVMFNSDVFDRKQIADTATGKNLDVQNVYDTLHPFAIKFGKTWTFGVKLTAKLSDREKNLVAAYTFGKDFKLKTLDGLIFDLKNTNGIGNPSLTSHINYDIAQIIFSEKPLELQRYQLKEMLNPFSGKSEKEILVLLSGDLVSRKDKVLHANYGRIFDELEIEFVKEKKDFYKLKRLEQRKEVYKKVDDIIAVIASEKPDPDLNLGD